MHKHLRLSGETKKLLFLFLSWRILLIAVAVFAIKFIPLAHEDRFLGGGPVNYKLLPHFFSWANFDGEHYLSISIFGYKGLEQAFFPFYPMITSFFAKPYFQTLTPLIGSTLVGLFVSNISFIFALIALFELIKIDFSKKMAFITIILLLIFPTSFYFGSLYSESLFLLLSVLSFYFARKGKWSFASIFGFLSSATRIFGILLLPALLIEAYQQKVGFKKIFWLLLIPLGLGVYMLYQYQTIRDPLAFYHLQKIVGEQHQSGFTLLPQVYFRYIKMILTVDKLSPIYQTIWLEFLVGLSFFILPIYGYFKKIGSKRIRMSYLFYAISGFLLPSIQGSFSSVPRYVIVFFPSFLALAIFWNGLPRLFKTFFILLSSFVLIIETALFLRGYWIA